MGAVPQSSQAIVPTTNRTESIQSERRCESRRALSCKATMTILEGPNAGTVHEVVTRDLSHRGLSFWTDRPLQVGQALRIELSGTRDRAQVRLCTVLRTVDDENGTRAAVISQVVRD